VSPDSRRIQLTVLSDRLTRRAGQQIQTIRHGLETALSAIAIPVIRSNDRRKPHLLLDLRVYQPQIVGQ